MLTEAQVLGCPPLALDDAQWHKQRLVVVVFLVAAAKDSCGPDACMEECGESMVRGHKPSVDDRCFEIHLRAMIEKAEEAQSEIRIFQRVGCSVASMYVSGCSQACQQLVDLVTCPYADSESLLRYVEEKKPHLNEVLRGLLDATRSVLSLATMAKGERDPSKEGWPEADKLLTSALWNFRLLADTYATDWTCFDISSQHAQRFGVPHRSLQRRIAEGKILVIRDPRMRSSPV